MRVRSVAAAFVASWALIAGLGAPSRAEMDATTALQMVLIDPSITDEALLAMIEPVTEEDVDALVAGLTGPLEACRPKAAVLLGKIRSPRTAESLRAAVGSKTPGLAPAALGALVAIGVPALGQLSSIVHDQSVDAGLREEAIATILGFGDRNAAAFLGDLLRNPVPGYDAYKVADLLSGRGEAGFRELVYGNLAVGVSFERLQDVKGATALELGDVSRKETLERCFAPLARPGDFEDVEEIKRSALLTYGINRFSDLQGSKQRVVQSEGNYVVASVRLAFLDIDEDPVVRDAAMVAVENLRERGILEGGEDGFPRLTAALRKEFADVQEQLKKIVEEASSR